MSITKSLATICELKGTGEEEVVRWQERKGKGRVKGEERRGDGDNFLGGKLPN